MSWFIESWSVLDGLAFAVHRDYTIADDSGDRSYIDPPDRVLYVAPPAFVPLPTRYATALAAARGNFQHRFADANGIDVGFESLEQLIELVRRAYVTGGANLQGDDAVDVPVPFPDPQGSPPFTAAEQLGWQTWIQGARAIRTDGDRHRLAHDFATWWGPGFAHRVRAYCDWSIHALAARDQQRPWDPQATLDLAAWSSLALELGDWSYGGVPWRHQPCATLSPDLDNALLDGLLHRVPVPRTSRDAPRWLGQHVCLALGNRAYLDGMVGPDDFVPLLVASLALGASRTYTTRAGHPAGNGERARRRAGDWLSRELPDTSLDHFASASQAIVQLAGIAISPTYRRRA